MAEYRDIGRLNNYALNTTQVDTTRRGQVYQATHIGEQSLPYMNRSFISFTYGGKKIEDFNLIATYGDRLDRDGYADFNDITSDYDTLDGQYYWGTHYKTNSINFTLSTDGIDQKTLDEFLYWFKAGVSRELILAEHPNRGIMARVSSPPNLDLATFAQDVTMTISNIQYTTKTTLFKGDISLQLVMDQPHWYAITNVLGKRVQENDTTSFRDIWTDVNGTEISIFASQDALKILYEDGIPLGSMIETSMLLGNGAYANVGNQTEGKTWSKLESASDFSSGTGARINGTKNGVNYVGIIAGAIVDASANGISDLSTSQSGYFFYSGNAPAPTIITFTLTPEMNGSSKYITSPRNSHTSGDIKYNYFKIESVNAQELRFTTPNVYTSYNKAIDIFTNKANSTTMDWETLRNEIRDNVTHPHARAWAIYCINEQKKADSSNTPQNSVSDLKNRMAAFWGDSLAQATFTFNSETGSATGTFTYKVKLTSNSFGLIEMTEDVGDMLQSNYIIIQDRNYPTAAGKIHGWQTNHPEYSHRITHNVSGGLHNIQVLYKNMYL